YIPSKKSFKHALPTVQALNVLLVSLLLCLIFSGYLPFISTFGEPLIPFSKDGSFFDYAIIFPLVLLVLLGAPIKLVRFLAIGVPIFFLVTNFETVKELFNLVIEYVPEFFRFSQTDSGSFLGSLTSSMITLEYGMFVYLAGVVGYVLVIIGFRYQENTKFWSVLFLKDDATLVNRATFTTVEAWLKATRIEITLFVTELKNSDKDQAKEKIKNISAKNLTIFALFFCFVITLFAYLFNVLFLSKNMAEKDVKQAIKESYTQHIWGVETSVDIDDLSISSCQQYSDNPIGIACHIRAEITIRLKNEILNVISVNEIESFQLEHGRWVYYD
ncbi:hypothetical protein, partial [Shewanella sp. KT0246]|uniref:hypothetical protein n=1 Tax=Shewanella sp. KT0246 TaxID=2815912 RepID=UPI001C7CA297